MPHIPVHPSAIKRNRQNLKRRARNRTVKSRVQGAIKDALHAIGADGANAGDAVRKAARAISKAASKGVMHRNTASRKAGRLAARLHKAQSIAAKA
jgi:small subunit ribosomal protein S20